MGVIREERLNFHVFSRHELGTSPYEARMSDVETAPMLVLHVYSYTYIHVYVGETVGTAATHTLKPLTGAKVCAFNDATGCGWECAYAASIGLREV